MSAEQLLYTSCRKGQSSGAGFQIRSMSTGIDPEEQREIISKSGYHPPRSAIREPTIEEINATFPQAFKLYNLKSGRWALTLSSYVGLDYSQRWGNFFAHTLVLDKKPPDSPIDYLEWEGWQTRLSPDEDTQETPPLLPVVDLIKPSDANSFSFQELKEFLNEVPGRADMLKSMIRAVFLGPSANRMVVIRDNAINSFFWIAVILKAMPICHYSKLTFSTYQYSLYDCALINATTPDTDFTFSETERNFQFYMFDLISGLNSELPEAQNDFASNIVDWMAKDHRMISNFHDFLEYFNGFPLDEVVFLTAVELFKAYEGQENAKIGSTISELLNFTREYGINEKRRQLIEIVSTILDRNIETCKPLDCADAFEFTCNIIYSDSEAGEREIVFKNWILLLQSLSQSPDFSGINIDHQYNALTDAFRNNQDELAAYSIDIEYLEFLMANAPKYNNITLTVIFKQLRSAFERVGRVPFWNQSEIPSIIKSVCEVSIESLSKVVAIMEGICTDAESLAGVANIIYSFEMADPSYTELAESIYENDVIAGRALCCLLIKRDPNYAGKVRDILNSQANFPILMGEYRELIDKAPDKQKAFNVYNERILKKLSGFDKEWRPYIYEYYLNSLPVDKRFKEIFSWIKNDFLRNFPPELARKCLIIAYKGIPLEIANPQLDLMKGKIRNLASELDIDLYPDKFLIIELITKANLSSTDFKDILNEKLNSNLQKLDKEDYEQFISAYLMPAFKKCKSWQQLSKIITDLFVEYYSEPLKSAYSNWVVECLEKSDWRMASAGIIHIFSEIENQTSDESELFESSSELLINKIYNLNKKEIAKLNNFLHSTSDLSKNWLNKWDSLRDEIEKNRSFGTKMLNRVTVSADSPKFNPWKK